MLSDFLISTPVLSGGEGGAMGGMGNEFGGSMDPELEMVSSDLLVFVISFFRPSEFLWKKKKKEPEERKKKR